MFSDNIHRKVSVQARIYDAPIGSKVGNISATKIILVRLIIIIPNF